MKKLVRKFAILGVMTVGIFMAAGTDASVNASNAARPDCQTCVEMQADCNWRCENGERGCAQCTQKVDRCFANCAW